MSKTRDEPHHKSEIVLRYNAMIQSWFSLVGASFQNCDRFPVVVSRRVVGAPMTI